MASFAGKCGCGSCEPSWFSYGWTCPCKSITADTIRRQGADEISMSVSQSSIGLLFGKRGERLQQLQQETSCKIRVEARTNANYESAGCRSVHIRSTHPKPLEREASVARCARAIQILCASDLHAKCSLSDALSQVDEEVAAEAAVLREAEELRYQEQMVGQVMIAVGDSFTKTAIRKALVEANWSPDHAQDLLFQRAQHPKPALDMQKLLEASRAANAARKASLPAGPCSDSEDASSSASTHAPREESPAPASKHVQAIRDVFANIRRY